MRLVALLAAVPCSFLLACSTVAASPGGDTTQAARPGPTAAATPAPVTPLTPLTAGVSAGNVEGTTMPDRSATELAALRAEGPAALDRLLAAYDHLPAGDAAARRALAATIDKVAGQRYATVSRLYWYDDLDAARAAAKASGKPILALRMLGRLDEDLSCANSRFFRTTVYPDAAVAKLLRARFVLYWSSERNVPRVTVDFGDGRKLESTVTGNSAHYVLDADGRPLDVLPGLYAPQVFVRELSAAADLHATVAKLAPEARAARLIAFHDDAMHRDAARWAALPDVQVIEGSRALLTRDTVARAVAAAQRATVSKAYVEVPMLKTVDVGVDPGTLPADVELWAEIGQRLLAIGPDQPHPRPILDARARGLVDAMLAVPAGGLTLDATARAAVIARLEQSIVADTALNESRLRPMIRGYLMNQLASGGDLSFATLNTWIYASVFRTPATDAWLGLLPRDTFTGLPGGAVVATN